MKIRDGSARLSAGFRDAILEKTGRAVIAPPALKRDLAVSLFFPELELLLSLAAVHAGVELVA